MIRFSIFSECSEEHEQQPELSVLRKGDQGEMQTRLWVSLPRT